MKWFRAKKLYESSIRKPLSVRASPTFTGLPDQSSNIFRPITVKSRNGEVKSHWMFIKVVRLERYGRKRLVIVHEQPDLTDSARFLLTDAKHWERRRIGTTTQGGSGQTTLSSEVHRAVDYPAGPCFWSEIRKICVRQGKDYLRIAMSNHSA